MTLADLAEETLTIEGHVIHFHWHGAPIERVWIERFVEKRKLCWTQADPDTADPASAGERTPS